MKPAPPVTKTAGESHSTVITKMVQSVLNNNFSSEVEVKRNVAPKQFNQLVGTPTNRRPGFQLDATRSMGWH
jgi:hypothetical protein